MKLLVYRAEIYTINLHKPTGNLDSETGEAVLDLLISSLKKYGQTLIMITHNKEIAARADRILTMKNGKLDENLGQAG